MSSLVLVEIFRDIRRRKFQVIAIIFTISIGLSMLSLIGNMSASMHLTIKNIEEKYSEPNIFYYSQGDFFNSSVIEKVKSINGVEIVEGKTSLYGSSIINDEFVSIRLYGTQPKPKLNTILLDNESIWGQFNGNVCIVDKYMADQVNLTVGDTLEVYTSRGTITLEIIALADASWSISFSRPIILYLFTPIETVQKMYNSSGYTDILVKTSDNANIEEVYKEITNLLKSEGYSFTGRYKTERGSFTSGITVVFSVLFIPSLLIAGLLLVTVLLNKIINEYRLFGVRKAVGFTPGEIAKMIILYAVILYLLSIPVAFLLSWGISILALNMMMSRFIPELKYAIDIQSFITSAIIGFMVILLFSIYPARKASKVNALNAIRWGFEAPKYKSKESRVTLPLTIALALRNITRRKKRSGLILLSLIVGSAAFMSIGTITDSIIDTFQSALTSDKSDAMIGYAKPINVTQLEDIRQVEGVAIAEGYHYWQFNPENATFLVNNVEKDAKPKYSYPLFRFMDKEEELYKPEILSGTWINGEKDVVVTYTVSEYLGIKVGDNLTVKYTSKSRNITLNFKVVGIMKSVWQNGWDFVANIKYAYEIGLAANGTYSIIAFKVDKSYEVESVVKNVLNVTRANNPTFIYISKYMNRGLKDITSTISGFMGTILVCTLIVLLIGVTVSFLLSIIEKKWEIGVMKAIGFTNKDVFRVVLTESIILAIASIAPSLLLGNVLANYFINTISKSGFFIVIYPYVSSLTLSLVILLPVIISMLSIIPAVIVARKVKTAELLKKMF